MSQVDDVGVCGAQPQIHHFPFRVFHFARASAQELDDDQLPCVFILAQEAQWAPLCPAAGPPPSNLL